MSRKRIFLIIFIVLALGILSGFFVYPRFANRGVDWVNTKKNEISFLKKLPNLPSMPEVPFRLGLDLQGGVHLLYQADLSNVKKEDYDSAMESLRDAIERRVNFFGVAEPVVQTEGQGDSRRLIIELAGILDPNQAIKLVKDAPLIEFKELLGEEEIRNRIKRAFPDLNQEIPSIEALCRDLNFLIGFLLTYQEDPCYGVSLLTGQHLERAEAGFNQTTRAPVIKLKFDNQGAKMFQELTGRNVGKPLAIYLDGQPLQTPRVESVITGGDAQITGRFTLPQAKQLARELNAGAIPVPIVLVAQEGVGATLGKVSLQKSLWAGIWGLCLVIIFMILFYRFAGFLASVALVLYVVFLLALLKVITTFTLAGIAGFILSIGMAVDANILIFSRMREELGQNKSFSIAVEEGFRRAWPSIRDGNLTTLLVALILFWFGSSFVKGFALTLSFGIVMSMVTAIFVTRNFLKIFVRTPLERITWLWR